MNKISVLKQPVNTSINLRVLPGLAAFLKNLSFNLIKEASRACYSKAGFNPIKEASRADFPAVAPLWRDPAQRENLPYV